MAGVGKAEGGGVTRLEQRGGVAIAFMAAALWIELIDSEQFRSAYRTHQPLCGRLSERQTGCGGKAP
jgi:hypothetical protein